MPTIYHRAQVEMVGMLPPSLLELRRDKSLCPPCELICFVPKRNLGLQPRQTGTTANHF